MRHFSVLAPVLCLLAFSGCGGSNSSPAPNPGPQNSNILYLNTVGGLLAFTINVDGSLSSLPNVQTVSLGPTIASSGSFLFGGQPGIFATPLASAQATFPGGNLQFVSTADFPVIGGGTVNFVTPCGKEVFAGDDLNALAPFAFGAQGSLSLEGPAMTYVGTPWNVAADPTCTLLYLPDTNSANLYGFQNANGILSLVSVAVYGG
jgi:hypothetical protein